MPLTPGTRLFTAGTPEVLFAGDYFSLNGGRGYDIAPDGQRFLMIKPGGEAGAAPSSIVVVQNWIEELRRLVPTD